jgi:adenylosuccinate lyase
MFFSEDALFKARVEIEIRYLLALRETARLPELRSLKARQSKDLLMLVERFSGKDVERIRAIERVTRHDVKAVEYWIKERASRMVGMRDVLEFIHFGLTSEDVNNLSYGLLIRGAVTHVIVPRLRRVHGALRKMGKAHQALRMLSLTHGQPATPTTLGKEMMVYADRLERQIDQLKAFRMQGKLGGAVGNFSAHNAAYPDIAWEKFRTTFVRSLGLTPLRHTTQINPHDDIAELSHIMARINTILLDASRDFWMYIGRGVFRQRVVAGEVGSSAMPHKVNPIDFENAEGNLGLSNALFSHFAEKLPVSRLQRDLSDSTVQRSIGVAFGYHLLAVESFLRGLGKVTVDRTVLRRELAEHPEVVAEAIQTVLRKHGVEGAYEKLKALTRGEHVSAEAFVSYINGLQIPKQEKEKLRGMVV